VNVFHLAFAAGLLAAGAVHAQLVDLAPATTLGAERRAVLGDLPAYPRTYAGGEGMPDPHRFDLYRADPRLYAGIDFNSRLALETSFTNPDYREGLHYHPPGPPPAGGIQMGVGGFNLNVGARLTVPIDDRLSAFARVALSYQERVRHGVTTSALPADVRVGATYQLNRRQSVTAEVPLTALARKMLMGGAGGPSGVVRLGF